MSGGIGGVPSLRGRFFKDVMEKKIRDPLISQLEARRAEDSTAAAAADAELRKKKKKVTLEGGSLAGTTESSGYSVRKETLG